MPEGKTRYRDIGDDLSSQPDLARRTDNIDEIPWSMDKNKVQFIGRRREMKWG